MPKINIDLNQIELIIIKDALQRVITDKCSYVVDNENLEILDSASVSLYEKINQLYIDKYSQN